MPPFPHAQDVDDDDDENARPQSYESITTIPRWRIDNLLDAGFTPTRCGASSRRSLTGGWR